jgi:hypothetical protein
VAAINAKLDRLLAQGSLDVREGSATKPAMKTPV